MPAFYVSNYQNVNSLRERLKTSCKNLLRVPNKFVRICYKLWITLWKMHENDLL